MGKIKPLKKRIRRSPEESRALILRAARQVMAEVGPAAAGLKRVADAAGVSHGLVTHYFGTFEALVEETMAATVAEIRAALFPRVAKEPERALELYIDAVFERMNDPVHARLAAWALLSGRLDADDFFTHKVKGFKLIVDAMWASPRRRKDLSRQEVEDIVAMIVTSAFGYGVARKALWGGMGVTHDVAHDERFRAQLTRTARAQLYGEE